MESCIFCNIVSGKIPCYKMYEDDNYIAFLDIFPRVKGHALLIPKKHYRWIYDVPDFGTYWETAKKVAVVVQKTVEARFISFVTVGEEVPHAHIHILPQTEKKPTGISFTPVISISKEDITKLAEKMKAEL